MDPYFALDYAGGPFELFGPAHLGTLAILAFSAAIVLRAGRRSDAARHRTARRAMAGVLLAGELGWHAWNLYWGVWEPQRMLPLHLCSIMVWITIPVLWTGSRSLYAFVYFLGVAGSAQALVTPDAGPYGFPHFRFFQTMLSHGLLVTAGLWIVAVERFVPTTRDLVRCLLALNAYALAVFFVNRWIGSNYLYVNGKPPTASLIDFMPAWPWYIPMLELIAVALFSAMLLPFPESAAVAAPVVVDGEGGK